MKIYTIVVPRDACGMYFQDESNLTYERAVKKANFEGLAREAFEDRVDDDGSALKQYGIGLYYDALYVEAGKEKIIEDELRRTGTDYAVSTVETQLGEYIAFRSFNFCDEIEGASMCRLSQRFRNVFLKSSLIFCLRILIFQLSLQSLSSARNLKAV